MENNKVAIVSGAARGIGQAIAHKLAIGGMSVIITDIAEAGEATAAEMRQAGLQVFFEKINVADAENVSAAVKKIAAQFGRINVLVNNAGIRPTKPFPQMSLKEWQTVLQVNLEGAFNLCSNVLPVMAANHWGRVINISSLAAQQGSTGGHSHYAASKAGLVGLSKTLAREYAACGITVNAVSPGWIDTEGWGGALDGKRDEYAAKVPLGRLGTAQDVANAVAFLASDEAAYITGITLPINGGLYIS